MVKLYFNLFSYILITLTSSPVLWLNYTGCISHTFYIHVAAATASLHLYLKQLLLFGQAVPKSSIYQIMMTLVRMTLLEFRNWLEEELCSPLSWIMRSHRDASSYTHEYLYDCILYMDCTFGRLTHHQWNNDHIPAGNEVYGSPAEK